MRIKAMMMGVTLAAGVSLGGCATSDRYGYGYDRYDRYGDRYGSNRDQLGRTAAGAGIGAAAGAAIGAAIPGVSAGEGAAVGALGGAIVGATSSNRDRYDDRYNDRGGYVSDRRWYRDDRGSCFFVDRDGRRIYDYNVRC
jgi:hypothetical protein